ncbi:helix-turn-helix transcriptional regulator [Brevibacillus laterosporus]|uniref:helix-turn-helix transcriptional regulator n=1 Tax=Brevibacillus laterosporus TaxID=1465 RepID=UPI003D26052F
MLENSVREHRARLKWSQQDLATAIGLTRQTIGLIEKGDYAPSVVMALKMEHVFQVSVEDLFQFCIDIRGNSNNIQH